MYSKRCDLNNTLYRDHNTGADVIAVIKGDN